MKYITVLDLEIGRVFQYENLALLENGWNQKEADDSEIIEWYLTTVKGHNLANIDWMVHEEPRVITTNHEAYQ